MASTPGPTMEFLGRVAYEIHLMRPLLPTYLHLLVSAIFPIYTAAHASLARPTSAAPAKKNESEGEDTDEDDDDEPSRNIEAFTPSDAILFPLLAGCTLAGLYFILKYLKDPAVLNYWLGIYFAFVGIFFTTSFIKAALVTSRSVLLPTQYTRGGKVWEASTYDEEFATKDETTKIVNASSLPGVFGKIPLPLRIRKSLWRLRQIIYSKARLDLHIHKILYLKTPIDVLDVVSVALSLSIVIYHTFIDKPWFLTNLLGFSFCYGSLQFMTPGTSWTGTLLLSALFFYDIYFVFFTPMMVTVATKLDVPIKLLFPRPDGCIMPVGAAEGSAAMEEYLKCIAKKRTMAMLGLGDIVIPGMMLAFALRFDLYLFYLRMNQKTTSDSKEVTMSSSDKPQYHSATGSWGERLWISKSLRPQDLRMKQFPKTYFYSTVTGYLIGMITTVLVMQVFQHAQPALLYLVPGVLISFWGTALVKGDLKTLWNFSEVPDDSKKNEVEAKSKEDKTLNRTIDNTSDTTTSDQEQVDTDQTSTTEDSKANSKVIKSEDAKPGRLFYLSIDLVQPSKSTLGESPSHEKSQILDPASQHKGVDSVKMIENVTTKTAASGFGDRVGGEPPEKRRRKV